MKKFTLLTSLLLASIIAMAQPAKKVAIVIPIEIKAMDEIIESFEKDLQAQYAGPITFKVANAQGDMNLEHAAIASLRDQNYDLIAPVGTDATAMTLSLIKTTPILSLASDLSDAQRKKLNPCNVAVVHDEISNEEQLAFIHQAFPEIKNIVLIHSAADKIFPEVEEAKSVAKKLGITITSMMAATLPELQTIANNLPENTQAIYILKDMQIVSGTPQLAKIAQARKIPLISSDDGSVKNGAGFALGVHENQIGVNGAILAAAILNGKNACDLPISEMKKLTVFLNPKAMENFRASEETVKLTTKNMKYQIEIV
ncbi:MAG: ABC transporter substrate binding protein [Pseudomonadota bacterium]